LDSCCVEEQTAPAACARCGKTGRRVDRITLKALLRPEALKRLGAPDHRFCATPHCPIVYFGRNEVFEQADAFVRVFQKEQVGARMVCYCFGETETDIRLEVQKTGRSTAAERITELVAAGRCACEVRNPQGSCCLGNVALVIKNATERVAVMSRG
jgi:hypothetical protein